MRLHHVQLACPPGGEDVARRFWVDGIGLEEVAKPPAMAARGGAWFCSYDAAGAIELEVHVGVEETFVAARKAHPALVLDDVAALDALSARLEALGHVIDTGQADPIAGFSRWHTYDGHGNRVEVLGRR